MRLKDLTSNGLRRNLIHSRFAEQSCTAEPKEGRSVMQRFAVLVRTIARLGKSC